MLINSLALKWASKTIAALGLGAIVAGCDIPLSDTPASGQAQSRAVNIGLMIPSGSGDPALERIANSMANSARLAIAENPNVKANLFVYNTGGDPSRGRALAQAARADGVDVIVGPLIAAVANEVGVEMARTNTSVLTMSNTADIAGANVFVMGNTFDNTANRLVGYAASKGIRSIGTFTASDDSGGDASDAVRRAAARSGVRFDSATTYDLTRESIQQNIVTVSQNAAGNGTQGLVLSANASGALPTIGELIGSTGVTNTTKLMGLARWDIPTATLRLTGLNKGWFAVPDFATSKAFESRYQASFGEAPNKIIAAAAYDGMTAVLANARSGGLNNLTPSALASGPSLNGANGLFKLQKSGLTRRALAIAEVANGQYTIIDAAPKSFRGTGF